MRIMIINGPNLNLLGKREPQIYGNSDFESFLSSLKNEFSDHDIVHYQSNIEGELVSKIQENGFNGGAIILNAAAYTHTSVAISDAIAAIDTPVLEVHISNIYKREEYRHKSLISGHCVGLIAGLGLFGYHLAITYFLTQHNRK